VVKDHIDGAIGILTGGGDCPGLNAVIRAVVRKGIDKYGHEVVGFRDGWRGVLENRTIPLDTNSTRGILHRGGTILGSSRTNPIKIKGGITKIKHSLEDSGIGALIAIGGEDTLGVAAKLHEEGVKVVGCPKTIDNDLSGTDYTFGFQTAVQIATEAIDRLVTTAESHHRILVVEVMGRHAGWIALYAGLAGGAEETLIPEFPFDIEAVCRRLRRRHSKGRYSSIVVVAEGALPAEGTSFQMAHSEQVDAFGHPRLGGVGVAIANEIENRTSYETRAIVLGHLQRGGTPTAYDRVLATRFGISAVDAAVAGRFGVMVALRGTEIVEVPLSEATGTPKLVDKAFYEMAQSVLE